MNDIDFRPRIKWSEFVYGIPLKIIITDWKNSESVYYGRQRFLLVDSLLGYKGKTIQLCVPYMKFVNVLKKRPEIEQKLVVQGKAVIELVKEKMSKEHGGILIKSIVERKNVGNKK